MIKKILVLLMVLISSSAHADKGYEISKHASEVNKGFKGLQTAMKMILINAHGDKVERTMLGKVQERPKGDQSMFIFKSPGDVKGTKMLTWTNKKGSDDQWLFLPSLKRVKRINSSNKKGSFMGSEFSYEDLSAQEVEKFTYKYIKEGELDGRKVHIIERYPVEKKSGYSKQIVYLDQEYNHGLKVEYFDRKGELLKIGIFSKFNKVKTWWFYDQIEMSNVQTHKKSILSWSNRVVEKTFSKGQFDSKKLAL